MDSIDRQEHEAWHRERLASVTSARGNLALVETRWYPAGTTIPAEASCATPTRTG
ncbi:hypothetical protein [Microbacterium elymi]|uniref:Uncharacterized protein n=1 Tax=Microbacterium elymi TaxID=2909587 RepID=A0ABY5NME6_9MICO|nr:hypothetical protein [Microbacterium elymi]UUT36357.1 hypothetical protein L2X98_25830 [Microbacterium elymi]